MSPAPYVSAIGASTSLKHASKAFAWPPTSCIMYMYLRLPDGYGAVAASFPSGFQSSRRVASRSGVDPVFSSTQISSDEATNFVGSYPPKTSFCRSAG